jgi:hypothetical protein
MKNILKLTFICSALILGYSCTDLEEELEGSITAPFESAELPSIPEGATGAGGAAPSAALGGAYDALRGSSAGHGGYYSVQTVASDEQAIGQKGGDWFDGGIWLEMQRQTLGSANGPINSAWADSYAGISEANLALDNASLSPSEVAQAKVLRALFHWRLLDMFGRVKILDGTGADNPQSTRLEVFNFVESELLAAIGSTGITASMDLSGSPIASVPGPYGVNTYGALGLLAKLYLNAEVYTGTPRYEEADWAASYIIDNGSYQLADASFSVPNLAKRPNVDSDPAELVGYPAAFAPNNQNSPETVWAINYDAVTGGGMNFIQMNLHYSSQQTFLSNDQPWNGYQVLEEFYNSYDANDLRREASFLAGPQLDFDGSALLDYAADDDDLQLTYTPEISQLEPNSIRESGARAAKFSFQLFSQNTQNNDYPLVRLGDVHLMRGEARARAAGDWSLALPDVNAIKARAGLAAVGSITADEFLAERGKEMFQEATRRTDLIRFGKFTTTTWWEKSTTDAHRVVFPIPQPQIDASNGSLTQNPGY